MSHRVVVENTVLELLSKSNEPLGTKEICTATGLSYDSVVRLMRTLARNKQVKRLPGRGHSFVYKYLTHERPVRKDLPVDQSNIIGVIPKKFTSEQLLTLVEGWANDGWSPAVTKSTSSVRESLSELYRWSLISASGNSITSEELKTPYDRLMAAKRAAESYLEFVTGLMSISELWDGKTFAAWLLSSTEDLDSVADLADILRAQSKH